MRYQVGDACQLDLAKGAYDVVFSNWLLMYLCDDECAKLAADALSWVSLDAFAPPPVQPISFCFSQQTVQH